LRVLAFTTKLALAILPLARFPLVALARARLAFAFAFVFAFAFTFTFRPFGRISIRLGVGTIAYPMVTAASEATGLFSFAGTNEVRGGTMRLAIVTMFVSKFNLQVMILAPFLEPLSHDVGEHLKFAISEIEFLVLEQGYLEPFTLPHFAIENIATVFITKRIIQATKNCQEL
jgi:hypothetical protein